MSTENSLVVRNASGNPATFTQQGTIDWTSLSHSTVSASVAVMHRLSTAGIDPFTIVMGQAVTSRFQLSRLGDHRLSEVIRSLKSISGFGEAFWLGFGVKSIIRTLASTTEGKNCVMMCSSLAENHNQEYSARVLSCLLELYKTPGSENFRPSLDQWLALVKVCAGILSTSSFSLVAEHMMNLAEENSNPIRNVAIGFGREFRSAGRPEDVARALDAIARLSNGTLLSATFVGGYECGWLAAVAHWFFEIGVELRNANGDILESCGQGDRNLIIIFDNAADANRQALSVQGETYVIRDLVEAFSRNVSPPENEINGRVSWKNVLVHTFGTPAEKLLSMSSNLGTAVGSAARIFMAITRAEPDGGFSFLQLSRWPAYSEDTFGQGYVNAAVRLLPELAESKPQIQEAFETSYKDAVASYETSLAHLATICTCLTCNRSSRYNARFCLAALADTVIRLIWLMGNTHLDVEIPPTRSGLESVFYSIDHSSGRRGKIETLVEPSFPLFEAVATLFSGAVSMFLPGVNHDLPDENTSSAKVVNGLIVYREIVRELSDNPKSTPKIHVLPGRIETTSGRVYYRLHDSVRWSFTGEESIPDALGPQRVARTTDLKEPLQGLQEPGHVAILKESFNSLSMCYRIQYKPHGGYLELGPNCVSHLLLHSVGLISCNRPDCTPIMLQLPLPVIHGEGKLPEGCGSLSGKYLIRQVERSPLRRLVALAANSSTLETGTKTNVDHIFPGMYTIFQTDQCTSCCIRAALGLSMKELDGIGYAGVCIMLS